MRLVDRQHQIAAPDRVQIEELVQPQLEFLADSGDRLRVGVEAEALEALGIGDVSRRHGIDHGESVATPESTFLCDFPTRGEPQVLHPGSDTG